MFRYPFDEMHDPLSLLGLRDNGEFCVTLRCQPLKVRDNAAGSFNSTNGKLILPMSVLQKLTISNVEYPMLFKITNLALEVFTHAGVLEFTAEEGVVHVPKWLQNTLSLQSDDLVKIERVMLPQGKFVKIQPQSTDFLEISDPKAVLENALVNFPTLSKNDRILFEYNSNIFEILVLEIGPDGPGISIYETDLEVDFAPPVGYVPPAPPDSLSESKKQSALKIRRLVTSSSGSSSKTKRQGVRLSGKKSRRSNAREVKAKEEENQDLDPEAVINLAEGQLFFGYPLIPCPESTADSATNPIEQFPLS